MQPAHIFFCEGSYCSVMLTKPGELCNLCTSAPKGNQLIELTRAIINIKEKLTTSMTPAQCNDWKNCLVRCEKKLLDIEKLKD
jgi:hypothetical protein